MGRRRIYLHGRFEDIFRREETKRKTTSEKIYRTMNLEKWHHWNRKR
jgi:hypothetical protein